MSEPTHIHLDLLGGIAGDMFIAALLDCVPSLECQPERIVHSLDLSDRVRLTSDTWTDGILTGRRFVVNDLHSHGHHHTPYGEIRALIGKACLPQATKIGALGVFDFLAGAEAQVHGVAVRDVSFHEVGALDSIVDIVTATHLIAQLGPCTWSVSPIPIGSGRTKSQHGIIPVPAPATALLLEGMDVIDDGIPGERVTPTGAAILKYLKPQHSRATQTMMLSASGTGFGTARLNGIPNIVRMLKYLPSNTSEIDEIAVLTFEVDDQTPEDLATGLEIIRGRPDVLDVFVSPVLGKKNRQAQHVQIMGVAGSEESISNAAFAQTTTLGVRIQRTARRILQRHMLEVDGVGVKIAHRTDGVSAKPEADHLAGEYSTAASRASLSRRTTEAALAREAREHEPEKT